ncbi:hypothetical protein JKP88DRAFT_262702 [Tribonema minus]|uniref:Man1/Src1 C-terminal domain-containing protein n=1 Tax=Tribonema minus TaxID=303371 RepID=A0A836CG68_9STRA|nr:hypothetical protein JKP88DRAFT_262702 [Tribonema minus]
MATGGGNSLAGGGAGAKGMTDQTPAKRKEIAKSAQKYIEETFNHSDKPKPPPYAAVAAERRSGEATSGTKRPALSREEQRRKAREWAEKTLKGQAGSAAAERGDSGGESPPLKKRHTAQQPHSDAARAEAAASERRRAREWADANAKGKKRAHSPPPQQQQRRARPLEGEDSVDVDNDSDAERRHRRRHEASMKLEEEEEEEDEEEGFHSSTDAGEREPPRKAPRRHPPLLPPPQPQQPQWQQPAAAPALWETRSGRSAVAGAVGFVGSGAGGSGGAGFAGSVSAAGGSSGVGGGAAGRGGTGISRHAVDGSSSSSGAFYPARVPPAAPQGFVPPRMPMPPLPIASTTPPQQQQQQQHQRHSYGGSGSGAGGRYGVMYGAGDGGIGYGGGGSTGGGTGGGRRSLSPPRGRLAQFVQEQEQGESPPGARVPVSGGGGGGGGGGAWLAEGAEGDGGRADEGVAAALGNAGGGSAVAGRRRRAPPPPPPAAPPAAQPIAQLAATQQRRSRRARLATAALALAAAALVVVLAGWGLVLVAPRCWATASSRQNAPCSRARSVALAQLWSRAHAALQYGGRVCYGDPPGGVEEGVCREWRPCPRAGQHGDACALEPRLRSEAERARNFLRKSVEAHLCSGAPPPRLPLPPPLEACDADGDAAACAVADARVLPTLLRRGLLDDTFTVVDGGAEFALSEREEQLVPLPLGCAIKRGATAFAKERQREISIAVAALLFLLWVDGKRRARYRRIVLATKLRNAAYRYLVEHARDVEDKPVPVSHIQAHALERVGLSAASSRVRTRALTDAWPWVQRKVDKDPRVRLVFANVRGQHNVPAWCWTAADRREEAVLPLPIPEPPRLLFLRA